MNKIQDSWNVSVLISNSGPHKSDIKIFQLKIRGLHQKLFTFRTLETKLVHRCKEFRKKDLLSSLPLLKRLFFKKLPHHSNI